MRESYLYFAIQTVRTYKTEIVQLLWRFLKTTIPDICIRSGQNVLQNILYLFAVYRTDIKFVHIVSFLRSMSCLYN